MNRRPLLIGILAVAVIALGVIGYLYFAAPSADGALPESGERANVTLTKDDRTMGDPKAPVLVVEYAALTCPHCAHFNETVFPKFKAKYIDTGKVYYVFRVFPLSSVDLAVESLARCLLAAGLMWLAVLGAWYVTRPGSSLAHAGAVALMAPLVLNFAWVPFDRERRSLIDVAARTRVRRVA